MLSEFMMKSLLGVHLTTNALTDERFWIVEVETIDGIDPGVNHVIPFDKCCHSRTIGIDQRCNLRQSLINVSYSRTIVGRFHRW
jgi:hypothetical protein